MKYALFSVAVLFGVPLGAMLVAISHKYARLLFMAMILIPVANISIKFFPHEWYLGDARGISVDLSNLVALMLLGGLAISPRYRSLKLFPKNSWAFMLFMFFGALSMINAYLPLFASFTFVQLLLAFMMYITVYNFLRQDPADLDLAATTFAVALLIQALVVFREKYIWGIYRVTGTFWHPNTLSIYVEMLLPILLAVLLFKPVKRNILYWAAIVGGFFCVTSTFSRGGLVMLGGAVALVLGGSLWQKVTARKTVVIGILIAVALAGAVKASDSIIRRFNEAPAESGETRDNLNGAAREMAADHLFGVGLNNYYYAVSELRAYAKYFNLEAERAGVCHHIYNLFAAETGYPGLFAFLMLLFVFYWPAFKLALARPPTMYTTIGLGIFAGFTALHIHGLLEWIWRQLPITYLFFAICGVLIAAEEHAKREKRFARVAAANAASTSNSDSEEKTELEAE